MTRIFNFIQIDENVALAGQPSPEQLHEARAQGCEVVINLAPTTVFDGTEFDEARLLAELGVDYQHIPVPWTAPDRALYERFAAAMERTSGRKTLIHCAMNYRVTAFYAIYAMERLGWSPEQAEELLGRIWNSRPDLRLEGAWKQLVDDSRARVAP